MLMSLGPVKAQDSLSTMRVKIVYVDSVLHARPVKQHYYKGFYLILAHRLDAPTKCDEKLVLRVTEDDIINRIVKKKRATILVARGEISAVDTPGKQLTLISSCYSFCLKEDEKYTYKIIKIIK